MQYRFLAAAFAAASLVAATPVPEDKTVVVDGDSYTVHITENVPDKRSEDVFVPTEAQLARRGKQTINVDGETFEVDISDLSPEEEIDTRSTPVVSGSTLFRRGDHISSCYDGGDNWIPVEDVPCYSNSVVCSGGKSWRGWRTAVDVFCKAMSQGNGAVVVPKKSKAVMTLYNYKGLNIGRDFGKDPKEKMSSVWIEFEIHNKGSDYHLPFEAICKANLMKMATPGEECYGEKHKDTKGGTYQYGDTSYHGKPLNK